MGLPLYKNDNVLILLLKKIEKRKVSIDAYYSPEKITIQNYGNAMNYYVKLYDCGEKYIHFKKVN